MRYEEGEARRVHSGKNKLVEPVRPVRGFDGHQNVKFKTKIGLRK